MLYTYIAIIYITNFANIYTTKKYNCLMLRNATCQCRKSFITREFPQNNFGKEKTTHQSLSSCSCFCHISEQSIPILSLVQFKYTDSFLFLVYVLCVPTQWQLDWCMFALSANSYIRPGYNKQEAHPLTRLG